MSKINKIAILIDAGFYKQCFRKLNGRKDPAKKDVEDLIKTIIAKVQDKSNNIEVDILFRTFYYDCLPYGGTKKHPKGNDVDFSKSDTFKNQTAFINSLKEIDQFAMRLGEVSFSGWKINPMEKKQRTKPDLRQKGVDMKIGLDMAWLAGKKTIEKIVLVAGDSDFISPIKFVRKEGLLVYLYPMNNPVKSELKEHCDFVLKL